MDEFFFAEEEHQALMEVMVLECSQSTPVASPPRRLRLVIRLASLGRLTPAMPLARWLTPPRTAPPAQLLFSEV